MDDLTFVSHLSEEEINENFQNIDFFSGVMEGLQDALAHKKDAIAENNR